VRIRSVFSHSAQAIAEGALISLLVVGLMAGTAFAGKGNQASGGSSSVSVVLIDSSDGVAHFGQHVTFNVSTSAAQPWVHLNCYQGSTWVDGEWGAFYAGAAWGKTFTLGPTSLWVSGAADCKADLVVYTRRGTLSTLATTSFHVDA
jgi:hypothetical protein